MSAKRSVWAVFLLCLASIAQRAPMLHAQNAPSLNGRVAENYALYVKNLIDKKDFKAAEAALSRAKDYADISSDINYEAAFVNYTLKNSLSDALITVQNALFLNRFSLYSVNDARILETRLLLQLQDYSASLRASRLLQESVEKSLFTMQSYMGLGSIAAFANEASIALDRYPRNTQIVSAILRYASLVKRAAPRTEPSPLLRAVVDRALRVVPLLIEHDSALFYLAAPFLYDKEEAAFYLTAYRQENKPSLEALPPSLEMGVIDFETAQKELFEAAEVAEDVIRAVWELLRNDEERALFEEKINVFTGVITQYDKTGLVLEGRASYKDGVLLSYHAGVEGATKAVVDFSGGVPRKCIEAGLSVEWEAYPALRYAEKDGALYDFPPRSLFYQRIKFTRLGGEDCLLFPELNDAVINERVLSAFASTITRSASIMEGARETVRLKDGIPYHAETRGAGRIVATMEFEHGFPTREFLDLDGDGFAETTRLFRPGQGQDYYPAYKPSIAAQFFDFDQSGIPEYKEEYALDGTVTRFWDIDEDGIFEHRETN